ncbi:MAG: PAS domain S-box protein [Deltaproteobacteria bacterium]|nr:PAS domain S-box protein [Deltaproteobacteria bacterium]
MRLRFILLVLSLLAFLSAAAGGYFYYHSLRDAFFEAAKQDAISHVHTTNNLISQHIMAYTRLADVLSDFREIRMALTDPDDETLDRANGILDHFQKGARMEVCYLMDHSGRTIASSNRFEADSFVGKDYSFRPYFQAAMGGRSGVGMAMGVTSRKRGLYVSYPVYGQDPDLPIGAVVVKGSAESIVRRLLRVETASHASRKAMLFITDPHGVIFISDAKGFLLKTLWKTDELGQRKIAETRQFGKGPWAWSGFKILDSAHQVVDASGDPYQMYEQGIENLPGWKIVYLSNLDAISSLIANPLLKTAAYLIIGLCILIGAAIFLLNNLAHAEISRRKRAEASLKASESKLRTIIEHSNEFFYIHDTQHRLNYASPGSSAILGYSPEEMLVKWTDLATDNPINLKGIEITERAIRTGEKQEPYLIELSGKDGRPVLLEIDESPIKDDRGRVVGVSGAARNVTQKILAEKALRESEERYRILVEESFDGIFVQKGPKIIFANGRLHQMLGYDDGELLGLDHWLVYHPESQEITRKRAEARMRGENVPSHYVVKLGRKDGSWFYGEIAARVIDFENEPGIQVWVKDIHERKQAEQALQENEQRMRAILRASPVGIGLVVDRELVWANETMHSLAGYGLTDLLGQKGRALYPDQEEYERVGWELYTGRSPDGTSQVETRWVRKDGTIFDCMIRSCLLETDDPSRGHIVVVTDISEAKRLQAQLQRAQKMEAIGTLAGGVAHDLNNILSGLVSYPELLLMQIPADSPLRKPILTIQRSGERAAAVVQDLLTLARRGVAVSEVVNLNDVILQYLKSPEYEKLKSFHPGVDVETHLETGLLNISGSPVHLSTTVMNLISNAAEAVRDGGNIVVSTENRYIDRPVRGYEDVLEGDYVVLTVTDPGVGISADDIKKIFEPFYTKKKMGRSGTGLGMSVVWGTVKDHHGYIDIESREGEETTFSLYFPATRKTKGRDEPPLSTEDYRGRGESILIVDDVEQQRDIASEMLKGLGYSVAAVSSGEEAVEYVKTHPVDLLILDMIMDPGMDGLETYRRIIRFRPGQKAVIASGFSETERVREAQRLRAGAYVKKPFLSHKIGRAVRAELDK